MTKTNPDVIPDNAQKFPGVRIGDILYYCDDIETGLVAFVVVAVVDDHARVVAADRETYHGYSFLWADGEMFRSPGEAITWRAKEDIDYHGKQLRLAERALAAVKGGEDLTPFIAGMSADDFAIS